MKAGYDLAFLGLIAVAAACAHRADLARRIPMRAPAPMEGVKVAGAAPGCGDNSMAQRSVEIPRSVLPKPDHAERAGIVGAGKRVCLSSGVSHAPSRDGAQLLRTMAR